MKLCKLKCGTCQTCIQNAKHLINVKLYYKIHKVAIAEKQRQRNILKRLNNENTILDNINSNNHKRS